MSKRKGLRTQRKCVQYYLDEGWTVEVVERTHKFAKIKDLFNLFDILAIKERGESEPIVAFIQVKTNQPATQKRYKEWATKYCSDNIWCIVQTWYDHKGWIIQRYLPDETIVKKDLR